MKAGFDDLQKNVRVTEDSKAHFSAVMNFLRISGRHDIGAWRGYTGPGQTEGKSTLPTPDLGASAPDVSDAIRVPAVLLAGMGDRMAGDFTTDIGVLWERSGAAAVEVQWEEGQILLGGKGPAVARARAELAQILRFYFPDEDLGLEEAEAEEPEAEADGPRHWTESIKCTLSSTQRRKTLSKTQEMRERQRGAVKHWADRWEEYVKGRPELVGAERSVMKAGFDDMQTAEAGTATKVHFSLVMNFLRQSGRRTIGAWKDYAPKSWTGG